MRAGRLRAVGVRCARGVVRVLRSCAIILGWAALLMVVLACTPLPWRMHHWLGTAAGDLGLRHPDRIVVLGGSGMPSGPELLRLFHAADLARRFPQAAMDVVHTPDTAVLHAMVAELRHRGVEAARIHGLAEGTNTRGQALAYHRAHPGLAGTRIALVTAPENMYRSVRAFRKAGPGEVYGVPAWDTPLFSDLAYHHRSIGGGRYVPDVSGSNALRYDFWNRLKLQITCLRELAAIAYYRLNGWV
ncbi:MAG: YdcF family protein [Flavobacteriales bacterium]|jgi:uncharacterized SAM-binding protein YcdF (DUF218 family)|nr:YdcF family protein [Flavobacteriales bacterium]